MEIDWDSAPEWATHALTTGPKWDCCIDIVSDVVFSYYSHDNHYVDNIKESTVIYRLDDTAWIVAEERPSTNDQVGSHYNKTTRIKVSQQDADNGFIELRIDPHFVSTACNMQGGPMEHIFKKSMRGTDKGHDIETVYKEIIKLAERGLEINGMIEVAHEQN